MPTSSGKASGFTLIELLVVMSVLALAAALVVPPLTASLGARGIATETRKVVAALRESRAAALAAGRPVAFVLESPHDWRANGRSGTARPGVTLSLDVPPVGQGTAPAIRFFADGQSTGGRVVLQADERRRVVVVDWITGRVRAER